MKIFQNDLVLHNFTFNIDTFDEVSGPGFFYPHMINVQKVLILLKVKLFSFPNIFCTIFSNQWKTTEKENCALEMGSILKVKQSTISLQQMEILLLLGNYIQTIFLLEVRLKQEK
jgi:hypothetical protein